MAGSDRRSRVNGKRQGIVISFCNKLQFSQMPILYIVIQLMANSDPLFLSHYRRL